MTKVKKMTTRELWELAVTLRAADWFSHDDPLCFADQEGGEGGAKGWYGLLPVSRFDDDAWIMGYFGGGATRAVDLTDAVDEDDRAERIVEELRDMLEIPKHNPTPDEDVVFVDVENCEKYLEDYEKEQKAEG